MLCWWVVSCALCAQSQQLCLDWADPSDRNWSLSLFYRTCLWFCCVDQRFPTCTQHINTNKMMFDWRSSVRWPSTNTSLSVDCDIVNIKTVRGWWDNSNQSMLAHCLLKPLEVRFIWPMFSKVFWYSEVLWAWVLLLPTLSRQTVHWESMQYEADTVDGRKLYINSGVKVE